jgi:hypothetical protein
LIGTWACQPEPYAIVPGLLAVALALALRYRPDVVNPRERLLLLGSVLLATTCLLISLANNLVIAQGTPDQSSSPWLVRAVRTVTRDGVLVCIVLTACWWIITRLHGRTVRLAGALAIAVLFALMARVSLAEWTSPRYNRAAFDAFAPWRALIPPGEEVLWVHGAVTSWVLLQRPSYLSPAQIAAALFSREAAAELERRTRILASYMRNEGFYMRNEGFVPFQEAGGTAKSAVAPVTLADTCARANVKFIVTNQNLHAPAIASAPPAAPRGYGSLRLYSCPSERSRPERTE